MGKYIVKIKTTAKKDIAKHKKSGNQALKEKIIQILEELQVHPYTGTGKPELLKYELAGKWSRRLNQKDRLIYSVNEDKVEVLVLSASGHYYDH